MSLLDILPGSISTGRFSSTEKLIYKATPSTRRYVARNGPSVTVSVTYRSSSSNRRLAMKYRYGPIVIDYNFYMNTSGALPSVPTGTDLDVGF